MQAHGEYSKKHSATSEETELEGQGGVSRRSFLQAGAIAGGAALTGLSGASQAEEAAAASAEAQFDHLLGRDRDIANATVAEQQARMASGRLSAVELLNIYLDRIKLIDRGLDLRSIIQLNPDARRIAAQLDHERRRSGP